jgi:hypothetical protein
MNNSSAWATTAYGHQHRVEYELAGYRRPGRPPDDPSGEQIHDDGEVEPALPGAKVCNIRDPSLVSDALKSLIDAQVLTKPAGSGGYAIADPLFERWLKK